MTADTAAERIRQRDQAAKLLWWWRVPYLAILAVAVAMLWIKLGGLPGALVAAVVITMGLWVATMNPWSRKGD